MLLRLLFTAESNFFSCVDFCFSRNRQATKHRRILTALIKSQLPGSAHRSFLRHLRVYLCSLNTSFNKLPTGAQRTPSLCPGHSHSYPTPQFSYALSFLLPHSLDQLLLFLPGVSLWVPLGTSSFPPHYKYLSSVFPQQSTVISFPAVFTPFAHVYLQAFTHGVPPQVRDHVLFILYHLVGVQCVSINGWNGFYFLSLKAPEKKVPPRPWDPLGLSYMMSSSECLLSWGRQVQDSHLREEGREGTTGQAALGTGSLGDRQRTAGGYQGSSGARV